MSYKWYGWEHKILVLLLFNLLGKVTNRILAPKIFFPVPGYLHIKQRWCSLTCINITLFRNWNWFFFILGIYISYLNKHYLEGLGKTNEQSFRNWFLGHQKWVGSQAQEKVNEISSFWYMFFFFFMFEHSVQ